MNTVIIAMLVGLGFVILFGIYKIATVNLHEKSVFQSNTSSANHRQVAKAIVTVIVSILIIVGILFVWEYFSSR